MLAASTVTRLKPETGAIRSLVGNNEQITFDPGVTMDFHLGSTDQTTLLQPARQFDTAILVILAATPANSHRASDTRSQDHAPAIHLQPAINATGQLDSSSGDQSVTIDCGVDIACPGSDFGVANHSAGKPHTCTGDSEVAANRGIGPHSRTCKVQISADIAISTDKHAGKLGIAGNIDRARGNDSGGFNGSVGAMARH